VYKNLLCLEDRAAELVHTALHRQSKTAAVAKKERRTDPKLFQSVLDAYFTRGFPGSNGMLQLLALLESNGVEFHRHQEAIFLLEGIIALARSEMPSKAGRRTGTTSENTLFEYVFEQVKLVSEMLGKASAGPGPDKVKNTDRYTAQMYLSAVFIMRDFDHLVHPAKPLRLAWLCCSHGIDLNMAVGKVVRTHPESRIDDICALIIEGLLDQNNFWLIEQNPELVSALSLAELKTLLALWNNADTQDTFANFARRHKDALFPDGIPGADERVPLTQETLPSSLSTVLQRFKDAKESGEWKELLSESSYTPGSYQVTNAALLLVPIRPAPPSTEEMSVLDPTLLEARPAVTAPPAEAPKEVPVRRKKLQIPDPPPTSRAELLEYMVSEIEKLDLSGISSPFVQALVDQLTGSLLDTLRDAIDEEEYQLVGHWETFTRTLTELADAASPAVSSPKPVEPTPEPEPIPEPEPVELKSEPEPELEAGPTEMVVELEPEPDPVPEPEPVELEPEPEPIEVAAPPEPEPIPEPEPDPDEGIPEPYRSRIRNAAERVAKAPRIMARQWKTDLDACRAMARENPIPTSELAAALLGIESELSDYEDIAGS